MPLLFGLSILVQILLVIHIMKTGRNNYWIYLVIFAPLIGSVAYLIIELLPEFFATRTGRKLSRNLDSAINPPMKPPLPTDWLPPYSVPEGPFSTSMRCTPTNESGVL